MALVASLWDFAVHLDAHLAAFIAQHGAWVYALLFVIIFCETGLVVTPFLPGDSLLFVVGALAAAGGMDIGTVMALLVLAALCGDNTNYWIGRWAGPKVFRAQGSRWFDRRHLDRTHAFYERHGGKAIVIARFVPIVRTYVPFVAGIGRMPYARFLAYSVGGALLWVCALSLAGYWFGNIPAVKDNLAVVIVVIVAISVLPIALEFLKARLRARRAGPS
ncbi:MAG TPA: DedA family protein [Burkholderiales bacterium]|nr:DedA family protein [Burkholderiales bacterium]